MLDKANNLATPLGGVSTFLRRGSIGKRECNHRLDPRYTSEVDVFYWGVLSRYWRTYRAHTSSAGPPGARSNTIDRCRHFPPVVDTV